MKTSSSNPIQKLIILFLLIAGSFSGIKASCTANFSFNVGAGGIVTFTSTSIGTGTATLYSWNFGDFTNNIGFNMPNTSHTYTTNMIYNVTLTISDSINSCYSTITKTVAITNVGCNASANFSFFPTPSGVTYFYANTNIPNMTYNWTFGDGGTGSGANSVHTYTASGSYNVILLITTPGAICTYSAVQNISITVVPCSLNASFTKTVTNATVNFKSTSTGTTNSTQYTWNFGDFTYGFGAMPVHTYTATGVYNVQLSLQDSTNFSCSDSVVGTVTITNVPCIASANFGLTKDSTFLLTWNAYPNYPWNVSAVNWSWGDGSNSPLFYPSHTYSAAGTYDICLSVTVACGSSTTFCLNSSIFRSSGGMVTINVLNTAGPNGIQTQISDAETLNIYPNPNNGEFEIDLAGIENNQVKITVYSLVGSEVFRSMESVQNGTLKKRLDLSNLPPGSYFVKTNDGNIITNAKIQITK